MIRKSFCNLRLVPEGQKTQYPIGEVFVPQTYGLGQFEAAARLDGQLTTLQLFAMRSMASGGAFHRAYTTATQQAFLEGHEHGFDYFGGVFYTLRYDNLKC